ncbi:MAG TPA: GNAT family N-acetyltransferase [Chitinophagaceae bacterium]|nr:GNAT family N-acetyltransferase [Chitinophagaceae bacterium]
MSASFTTDRLLITPLEMGDSRFIFELVNTPGWLKFIGNRNVHSNDDATEFIKNIIDNPDTDYWIVKLKKDHVCIGIVTFIKRNYLQYHDIGCAFLPQYVNNGYAYEATEVVLHYVIDTHKLKRIAAITTAENITSIKLLEKLGLGFLRDIMVRNEQLRLYEADTDLISISGLVKSFFSVFTSKSNAQPRLDLLKEICVPEVSLANRNMSKTDFFDLASFVKSRHTMLTDGTLMEFEEKEIFSETRIIKGIASRFSEYEKKGILYRKRFKIKGNKLFQFVKIKQSWKISSVVWEDYEYD